MAAVKKHVAVIHMLLFLLVEIVYLNKTLPDCYIFIRQTMEINPMY
jgi:hypothetical protein